MFSGQLLFALILLLIRVSDAGDSQDYDSLNNGQGKTPCEMKSDIESCSGSLDARDAALVSRNFPSPDQCTCTNVYFNVWSACLYSNGDASSTVLSSNWTDTCQQQGIEMTTDQFYSSNSMDLPSWTFINLPTNMTFDIATALRIATTDTANTTPTKWNEIQIIVPVVVGVVVSAAFVLGILIWRSRKSGFPILQRMRVALSRRIRNGLGARKIRAGSRDQGWVIDRPAEADGEAVEMFSTSSRRSTGHVRLSSSSSTHIEFVKPRKPTWVLPGKKLWKNSQLARKIRRTLTLLPVPWRNAPVSVQSISPPRKFEIDASSDRTRTDSTLENFRRGGFRISGTRTETTESALATSRYDYYDTIQEEDEEEDDSELDLEESGAHNEREHLISGDSNHGDLDEVMIISETGDNFTLRSHSTHAATLRIPPSPVQPRSSSPVQPIPPPPRTPVRERPRKVSHHTPPAPTYPAPLPPTQSPPLRSNKSLNESLNKPSIESILQSSAAASSNVGVGQPQRSPPQRRQLPLPTPPSAPPSVQGSSVRLPPPAAATAYTPLAQTQNQATPRNASMPLPRNDMNNPRLPVLPPRPPLEYATAHTRNRSASTDDSHTLPVLSSPPYRSSPLPDEFLIARSDSPPPPPSNLSSPPYTVTNFSVSRPELDHDRRDRDNGLPLILAPPSPPPIFYHNANNSHHRLMSLPSNLGSGNDRDPHPDFELPGGDRVTNLQSGLAEHRGYPFEATLSPRSHYRNFSDESLTASVRHARDVNGPSVDNRLLFPGAVRAVGYMSTNANNRGLQIQRSYESFQTALSDSQSSDFRRI
ncbi:hypothetical protein C8R41DRAFT_829416 [Lentinula lateritia]|uniref:Uncharacterized protein n=1 Tax=Lentinula lateritia TaxID=40482 RepID=A0ABQ8VHV0_9AGAR|nr:hypothetical protein C8R41DRAFT_829416 [Lentinula lateritia]